MIKFIIPNDYNQYLAVIFNNIKVEEYYWNIIDSEIYLPVKDGIVKSLFDKRIISGYEFWNSITLPKYYIVSANIQAYRNIENIDEINIHDEPFSKHCGIAITIVDSQYVEIYCRSIDTESKISDNVVKKFGVIHQ